LGYGDLLINDKFNFYSTTSLGVCVMVNYPVNASLYLMRNGFDVHEWIQQKLAIRKEDGDEG